VRLGRLLISSGSWFSWLWPEVEHAQHLQTADLTGELGQVVVGQDECLNLRLLPHRI